MKYRVYGHATITVTTVIESEDELSPEEIYQEAAEKFEGISSFVGNGGFDKLIGVNGWNDTIDTGEEPEWDDFEEE